MAALLNSALISLDAVLASVVSTSWESLVQVDMTPSSKRNFLLASLLNAFSGIVILVNLQYFLIRRFIWQIKKSDAHRRLEDAERPLVKLYGASFLSVLFTSWAMAIANLLTNIVTSFWTWIVLVRGIDLKDQIRNTCSHGSYSVFLVIMNIVYSTCVSIVVAWLGTKIRISSVQSKDKAWAKTLEISSRGLGDTAGWVLWYSGNFTLACLPERVFLSATTQILRVIVLGGFCAIMFIRIQSKHMKDDHHILPEKEDDHCQDHHHSEWDEKQDNELNIEEEEDIIDPNLELIDSAHKVEPISVRYAWISLIQEALLIIFALTLVSAYYLPLEFELGEDVRYWTLGIACFLTISLMHIHWYCGLYLSYVPRPKRFFHTCHFVMEHCILTLNMILAVFLSSQLCPWIISFAWMYLLEGWLHDNEWFLNLIFAIFVTCAVSIFMLGVMNYANNYLHGSGFAEKSWLFGVAANDFQTSLIAHRSERYEE